LTPYHFSHDPIASAQGDLSLALFGSFFPIPAEGTFGSGEEEVKREDLPGAIVLKQDAPIKINVGRRRVKVKVTNTGDRPIQVSLVPELSCEGQG
jgi:urease